MYKSSHLVYHSFHTRDVFETGINSCEITKLSWMDFDLLLLTFLIGSYILSDLRMSLSFHVAFCLKEIDLSASMLMLANRRTLIYEGPISSRG